MTCETLYAEIKASLKFFGLSFHEMGQVNITLMPRSLVLRHGGLEIHVAIPQE